jgi:predicted nucleic acid-binding protein
VSIAWLDANIIVWLLRQRPEALALLSRLYRTPNLQLAMSVAQRGEILIGLKPKEEQRTFGLLDRFRFEAVTVPIVDRAAELYRQWHPSHGVGANDMVLAATAEAFGGTIYTLNLEHFPMPGLLVERGWEK